MYNLIYGKPVTANKFVAFVYIHDSFADIDLQMWGNASQTLMNQVRRQVRLQGHPGTLEFIRDKKACVPTWKIVCGTKEVGWIV